MKKVKIKISTLFSKDIQDNKGQECQKSNDPFILIHFLATLIFPHFKIPRKLQIPIFEHYKAIKISRKQFKPFPPLNAPLLKTKKINSQKSPNNKWFIFSCSCFHCQKPLTFRKYCFVLLFREKKGRKTLQGFVHTSSKRKAKKKFNKLLFLGCEFRKNQKLFYFMKIAFEKASEAGCFFPFFSLFTCAFGI